ncbi:xanthine dehydrogenase family protein molybdopterin-binding subunit [Mycolicibacterium sp. P1-18]|uniref:xanthine dehydrogenase family protein molybdopterin-binding subunit n=1 Tax=Mycolicibacterium sp. P1-18 TaxID=2024615 RepID=UPI0011F346EB|nr:xanthine dehydrogenase family protein molybdopterin-binding subunit [Mycolicibacterium sp. P1-18]KAA0095375.1 xanthine dehydrogenase family protein molybdopterin-binding subunit [Mycolicibacterium sp. P1-18]
MTSTADAPGIIGAPMNRVEGIEKVTGHATYTADVVVPGTTYAVLVQSEIPHGTVTADSLRASTDRALAAPGVLHVLTPLNCPPLHAPPTHMTDDLPLERRPPLSDLTVQHVGQHMAVVVADTLENATAAASSFELTYETTTPQLSAREVLDESAGAGDADGPIRHGVYQPDHFVKLVEEKLQDSRGADDEPTGAARVSATYTTPLNTHYPIELSATVAYWDDDVLSVHDTTRWITGERMALAAYLGIPEDKIRILAPLVGGAFGSKSFLWMHVALCAVAAREVGRPVKLVLTRDQMFSSTGHRPRTEQHLSLVADDAAHILSTEQHTLTETSTVAHFCEPVGLSARFLYQSPRLAVSHTVARINYPTPCFMRGPGEAPGLFALEVAMDELAYATDVDPVDLRLRNDADHDQASGKPWSGKHLRECYLQGAERFGWSERTMAPRSLRRDGLRVGWGMATATYPGRRMPASCRVTTDASGHVRFASATHEVGTGVRTVMTQVAAEAAGLDVAKVAFDSGDSQFPDAPYSGASQTTATVGSAVHEAATEWRRRLDDMGGHLDRLTADQLDTLNFTTTSDGVADDGPVSQSFGAHFCEVTVDEEIGRVSVTRWVAMMDCGRVLNPKLARNQVMGGITFGLGMALLEQVPYDVHTAQLIGEYYLPTHADRPEFDIGFVDVPDYGLDPVGVRGIGEIGTCGVPAAISNAIFHATGKRLRNLPITLENLMTPFSDESEPGGTS